MKGFREEIFTYMSAVTPVTSVTSELLATIIIFCGVQSPKAIGLQCITTQ